MNDVNITNYQNDRQNSGQNTIFNPLTFAILAGGWLLYVFLAPIYVFKSGLPQPADIIMAVIAPLTVILFIFRQRIVFNRVFSCLCLIAGLFFSINILNFYIYHDLVFLYSSAYYVFNALVFASTVILIKAHPFKMAIMARYAIIFAIISQLIILKFSGGIMFREAGSFNNPNQLGYWSLLSASCLLILNYGRRMPILDSVCIILTTYFVAESLSRAALISHVFILLAFFLGRYVSWFSKIAIMLVILFYGFFQISSLNENNFAFHDIEIIETVIDRIDSIQREGGVVKERGYERLLNYPSYLFYGAGEGAYWRFDAKTEVQHQGLELHSGLATILMSYGVFGFLLFCVFILTIFQKIPWLLWFTLAAVMGYGMTHQHVRFTGFWIYLGIAYGMSRYVFTNPRWALGFKYD